MKCVLAGLAVCGLVLAAAGCKRSSTGGPARTEARTTVVDDKKPLASMIKDKIGIADCDGYFVKYQDCIVTAPPERRQRLKERVETLWQAWKRSARNEQGRKGLAATCRSALVVARSALADLKCTW